MRGSLEDGSGWYPYHNNSDCSWLIYPQDPQYDSIKSIKITFLRLDTEASGDTLYIYDGINTSAPLIGAFSGSTIPAVITSTGNKVLVKFHTNASIAKSGWQFDYESTFPVYCSGTTTLTSPSGSIEDGSGAKKYSNNSICHWKITPTGSSPLLIHFNSFETYDSTDFVKVYDLQSQEVLGVFTGNQIPPTLISQSGKMMILFMTNTTGVAQGWSADYHTSYVGINQLDSCQSEMTIYPNPTSGKITLHKDLLHPSTIEIIVYDITGNQVFFKKLESSVGSNLIMLNFESLNPASYYLVVDDGRQKDVKQLIIKK